MSEQPGQIVEQPAGLLQRIRAVREEIGSLPKDKVNPHFHSRFTGLETVIERTEPVLAKHGLLWLTLPGLDEHGHPVLHCSLTATDTGESIAGVMPLLLAKPDMQGLGSATTYGRRYALVTMLHLIADEDDDGNVASASGGTAEANGGDTVNLQNEGKGLRDERINSALSKVGLPAAEKPWGVLGRVPADKAQALSEALAQQKAMA